jgi:predicted histidine transporter YuiF (NhaC family)
MNKKRKILTIIGVILAGLVVIVGLIAAIIDSYQRKEARRQANIELEEREEAARQANIEEEASKHRITESEIDLIDLRLAPPVS